MKKHSLSIAILLSTFFSPHLFSTNLLIDYDEQKEGSCSTQQGNQVQQPKQVYDYTILYNKNINHTLEDIEDVEEDLESDVLIINAKLTTTNKQSSPLILGAVLQHNQNHEYHQYLIADTGLLSKATQPKAVKRAHKATFHLIKATRGHVSLQLLEWLEISKYYSVIALYTNRPVCRNCYLIAHSLWKKKLQTNKKGCLSAPFPILDKIPTLAQQYINTHLNLSLVQNLVVPMMGYVSKEKMNKAIQQKDEQITMLSNEVKTKEKQIDEKNDHIEMLNQEINKKERQLKERGQVIVASQKQKKPKLPLDEITENKWFEAAKKGDLNKLKNLFKSFQINIEKTNKDGKNALHAACLLSGSVAMVTWLLDVCKIGLETKGKYQMTPFLFAAQNGQLEITKLLKGRDANINAKDEYGCNALHYACAFSGSVEMTTWLLDVCKISMEEKGQYQATPFLCAVNNGQLGIVKLLRKRGANLNAKNDVGNNALHLACLYSGSVPMTTWLLDVCKIGLETKGEYKKTPFLCAVEKGQVKIAKALRKRGANIYAKNNVADNALHIACYLSGSVEMTTWLLDVCKIGLETKRYAQMTPFLCAANNGHLEIAKRLKERGANVSAKDKDGNNALHRACLFSGSVAMVTWLLDICKIGIETKRYAQKTPFLCAVEKGQVEIAKLLRERGTNINATDKWGDNALHLACLFSGSVAMVTWLLDVCKIGLETKGKYQKTPFLCAANKGQVEIAKVLREQGANIHAKNNIGYNALHWACLYSGSVAMVTWLLDVCKIGIEIKGSTQKTPFLCAVWEGQLAIAKLLKEHGANLNAKDEEGRNALQLACAFSGSVAMVTWLLDECHIDIETKGECQMTPFLCAALKGQVAIAKVLRKQGANIHAKDKYGYNALHYAKYNKHKKMINYLQSLGLRCATEKSC